MPIIFSFSTIFRQSQEAEGQQSLNSQREKDINSRLFIIDLGIYLTVRNLIKTDEQNVTCH